MSAVSFKFSRAGFLAINHLNSCIYLSVFLRFFRQFLLLLTVHQTSISMFRFIASLFQTLVASMTAGGLSIMFVLLFGGFVIPKCKSFSITSHIQANEMYSDDCAYIFLVAASMPAWLEWGFWVSPLSYGEIGLTVNEFLAPRWEKVKFNHSYKNVLLFILQLLIICFFFSIEAVCKHNPGAGSTRKSWIKL